MLVINNSKQKIIAVAFFLFQLFGCSNQQPKCVEVKPYIEYSGSGCLVYFDDSQDAMNMVYYFPICKMKNLNVDSTHILLNDFLSGVAFRIPRTGKEFKILKQKSLKFMSSSRGIIHYAIVDIHFDNNVSSMNQYSQVDSVWTLKLANNDISKELKYYISNELKLVDIKIK